MCQWLCIVRRGFRVVRSEPLGQLFGRVLLLLSGRLSCKGTSIMTSEPDARFLVVLLEYHRCEFCEFVETGVPQKPRVHSHKQLRQPIASLVADAGDGRARMVRVRRPVDAMDINKVKSTLKHILRDWSSLGAAERATCYEPVLAAIERHFPRDSMFLFSCSFVDCRPNVFMRLCIFEEDPYTITQIAI